jgi:glycosyltransferase involved in cell wall biosynthesis
LIPDYYLYMDYIRVLILGETFRSNGGGGITLINLFKNWPSDKLAVVTDRIYETTTNSNCLKFYQLGHLEQKLPFPLSLLKKSINSGEVDIKLNNISRSKSNKKLLQVSKSYIRKTLNNLLYFLGLYHFVYKTVLSNQLLDWISAYSPDIIYAQPFRYSDMKFIYELQKKTSIPLAIHIMDDSISFLNKPNLLYYYWQKKTKSVFRQLIDNSVVLLSISQFMSDEYYKRYNKIFIPVRNPIDLDQWLSYTKHDWKVSDTINIVYTGRLAIPNINSLFRFCEVVDNLKKSGINIRFDIYSIDDNLKFRNKIKYLKGVFINNPVPYKDVPRLIPKYDILLLPIDFNKIGIKYAKYSISTKTSEYMISGVPILLFAPKEVALTSYAIENQCMLCVTEDKYEKLSSALTRLINDESLRERLAKKAFDVARKDSDANQVRQNLKLLLNSNFKK